MSISLLNYVVISLKVALPKDGTTGYEDDDSPDSEVSKAEEPKVSYCGLQYGKCPDDLCCSLHNECGNSIAHCNVSLGCKRKWGVCH